MGRTLSFYKHKMFHYFHEFTNTAFPGIASSL